MKTSQIVFRSVAFLLLGVVSGGSFAADAAGNVTQLSGTLSVQKPDGTVKILSQKSDVAAGDVLATEKDSYAQVNFTDGSQATLRPNSTLKIEAYRFNREQPQADNLVFRLLKGGLRTLTGLVGKRGNQDAYRINTATATIGIRGSMGDTLACPCPGTTPTSDKLNDGVYQKTYQGGYIMSNEGGQQLIGEGELGFVKDRLTPPVKIPDPGTGLNAQIDTGKSRVVGGGGGGDCAVR